MDKFILLLEKKAVKSLWNCLDVLNNQILRTGMNETEEINTENFSFDLRLELTAVFTSPGREILMALIAWNTSMTCSIFKRSRTEYRAQNVPLRPRPSLQSTKTHTKNTIKTKNKEQSSASLMVRLLKASEARIDFAIVQTLPLLKCNNYFLIFIITRSTVRRFRAEAWVHFTEL